MSYVTTVLDLLGFGEKSAKWWAWSILIGFLMFCLTTFFLSYSLARRNRMIAQLTAKVTEQKAIIKVKDLEIKKKEDLLKLAQLRKDDVKHKEKRKEIRKHLKKLDDDEKKAKKDLKKKRKDLKDDSLDDLIKKAKRLTKETL